MVYVFTHVSEFPINTIIAWIINDYHEQGNIIITNLLLPLGHISNRCRRSGSGRVEEGVGEAAPVGLRKVSVKRIRGRRWGGSGGCGRSVSGGEYE